VFRQIPVLPVVVPVAAATFAVLLWSLRRRERLSVPRAAVALTLCIYAAGVVANTVFPIYLDKPSADQPWSGHLALVPFVDYELADAVMNILVFLPLGMLVPLFLARASWGRVLALGTLLSLMIEVTQYATAHLLGGGHIADVNDLIFNVAGAVLGFALFAVLSRLRGASTVVDRFRWRSAAKPSALP
jgi:glycopeptide antibiotics resistance protein